MPVTIPPELKKVTPYVRRAEELDKDKTNAESRLVAYYCRQYAVHTGIPLATTPPGKTCLGELLSNLEEEKTAMAAFNRDEAKFLCAKFADKIFDKADTEDRSGGATKNTAKTFYAAASFLEILNQFYKDDDESEELEEIKKKAVYAKWKATDILKAIKEGRTPTPGGYGEDLASDGDGSDEKADEEAPAAATSEAAQPTVETVTNDDDDDDGGEDAAANEPDAPVVRLPSTENHDESEREVNADREKEAEEDENLPDEGTEVELGPPPAFDNFVPPPSAPPTVPAVAKPPLSFTPAPTPPPMPPPPSSKPTPPPPAPVPAPAPATKTGGGLFGFGKKKKSGKLSKAEFGDAIELTKFALAAMEEKDAELATERLQKALAVLTRSS